ncbi:hypothetical protein QJS04_geneDACA011399 [Acorus gramineus]|uniref:Protein SSUH2 homolog n=1 Tax=Acorus gramineus TaxID=55184 RepID=A0AAV9AKY4_ACOGR|nr:hypothetical protein QJS04_geneDACA011399 [Acorus gramineus]
MEQPLLSGEVVEEKWSGYQSVGRSGSFNLPAAASYISADDVRSASTFPSAPYPSLSFNDSAALVAPLDPLDQAIGYPGGFGEAYGRNNVNEIGRHVLDEVEIRQLLINHIGHRCCWGSRPARGWKICAIEDCNVYVGTLETFLEERETIREMEPYRGGKIDGIDKGPELGLWELDLRSEFPLLFVPHKETRSKIPHSEAIDKCSDREPGFYKENQMFKCPACYGRGLIAHQDGSDTICKNCSGKGVLPCVTCTSRGLVKCQTCQGEGSVLKRSVAIVKWIYDDMHDNAFLS